MGSENLFLTPPISFSPPTIVHSRNNGICVNASSAKLDVSGGIGGLCKEADSKFMVGTCARLPRVFSSGKDRKLYDAAGRDYLGCSIAVDADFVWVQDDYSIPQAEPAKPLIVCSSTGRLFFSNSGTEANEVVIKFYRKFQRFSHPDNKEPPTEFFACTNSVYRRTMGDLALTSKEYYPPTFEPVMPGVTVLEYGDTKATKELVETGRIVAVFVEGGRIVAIQGEGGIYSARGEFLQSLHSACDEAGSLLVLDELGIVGASYNCWKAFRRFFGYVSGNYLISFLQPSGYRRRSYRIGSSKNAWQCVVVQKGKDATYGPVSYVRSQSPHPYPSVPVSCLTVFAIVLAWVFARTVIDGKRWLISTQKILEDILDSGTMCGFLTGIPFIVIIIIMAPTIGEPHIIYKLAVAATIMSSTLVLLEWKAFLFSSLSVKGLGRGVSTIDLVSSFGFGVIAMLLVSKFAGIPIQSIAAAGGIGGIIASVAGKDTISSILGGLLMRSSNSFSVGDYIKIGKDKNNEGEVVEMGLMTTKLKRDGERITFLNSRFLTEAITNCSHSQFRSFSMKMILKLEDKTSLEKIPRISEEIETKLQNHEKVYLRKRFPSCSWMVKFPAVELTLQFNLIDLNTYELECIQGDLIRTCFEIVGRHGLKLIEVQDLRAVPVPDLKD